MNFFTADLHFGHANVIRYCNRPYTTVEEMDRGLTENWNSRVRADDHVYILGDFTFKKVEFARKYLQRLHGHKHLILGNHDYFARNHPEEVADLLCEITPYKELKLEASGHTLCLMHYPLLFWNGSMRDTNIMLYGHIHNHAYCNAVTGKLFNALNVGVDVSGYVPLSEKEVLRKVREHNKELTRSFNGPVPFTEEEIELLGSF